jgi:hypothetical protein
MIAAFTDEQYAREYFKLAVEERRALRPIRVGNAIYLHEVPFYEPEKEPRRQRGIAEGISA